MDYKEALKDAPVWIKQAYAEFEKLPEKEKQKTPFLYFVLGKGKGTPPFKISKRESDYKDETSNPNFICGNCIFYYYNVVKKVGICSQIRGTVDYEGICRLWVGEKALK